MANSTLRRNDVERRPKQYAGDGRNGQVTVDGRPLPLRLDLANHSPTGFSWGYGGSGPAQLALAILAEQYGDNVIKNWGPHLYQAFKWEVIAGLPQGEDWAFTGADVHDWYKKWLCVNN